MRAVIYSMIPAGILGLAEAARMVGLEPVAVLTPRDVRSAEDADRRAAVVAETPDDLDVCFVVDKSDLVRLTAAYEPAIGLCAGYRWLLPPEVIAIPRFGVVNSHPALLPRHRGPYPFAWAIREGDAELGLTLHLMDERFDTGPVLAQGSRPMPADQTIGGLVTVLRELARELYPDALQRVLAGERGAPQRSEGVTWAGPFGEDYVELDPGKARAELLRQVRAWQVMFDTSVVGPVATIEGRRVHVKDASLDEPDDPETLRLDAADGPLWLTSVDEL
ncbi:MAG TPA: formyltransferase family protein [Gaiella sp.]|jgi:methionyl-tRNA formyltransferase|nr:formyltransferase family protein [Gaiella sp.]